MENYIFRRDYSEQSVAPENITAEDLAPNPLLRSYLKFYGEFMSKVPKIIVPKDKESLMSLQKDLAALSRRVLTIHIFTHTLT